MTVFICFWASHRSSTQGGTTNYFSFPLTEPMLKTIRALLGFEPSNSDCWESTVPSVNFTEPPLCSEMRCSLLTLFTLITTEILKTSRSGRVGFDPSASQPHCNHDIVATQQLSYNYFKSWEWGFEPRLSGPFALLILLSYSFNRTCGSLDKDNWAIYCTIILCQNISIYIKLSPECLACISLQLPISQGHF